MLKKIKVLKHSKLSPFKTVVALVSPKLLGTHELVKDNHITKISFEHGWHGPPIAVAHHATDDLYRSLNHGFHYMSNDLAYGDLGVLDGHCRLKVSLLTNFKLVPVQLFPYQDARIIVDTWLTNFIPLTKKEITMHFKEPNSHVLPKATKHQVLAKNGQLYRLSKTQPSLAIEKSLLLTEYIGE